MDRSDMTAQVAGHTQAQAGPSTLLPEHDLELVVQPSQPQTQTHSPSYANLSLDVDEDEDDYDIDEENAHEIDSPAEPSSSVAGPSQELHIVTGEPERADDDLDESDAGVAGGSGELLEDTTAREASASSSPSGTASPHASGEEDGPSLANDIVIGPEFEADEDENVDDANPDRENDPPDMTATDVEDESYKVEPQPEERDTRFFPALQLREVLVEILAHSDNSTNAAAARVSSNWSDAALDTLYRRSPELYDLVSILAPITETSFSRELLPADWDRFNHYAPRVHTLSHDTTGSMSGRHLSETVFQELALSRPAIKILPNLRTFSWTASRPRFLRASVLFLHDTLSSLTIRITRADGAKTFDAYLKVLTERVPKLTHFELDSPRPVSEYEEHLCTFLAGLKCLTKVVLPHFFLSTKVVQSLAQLPLLESVTLRKADHIGESKDLASLTLPHTGDAFPSIKRLSVDTGLHELQNMLNGKRPQTFAHLEHLHVSSLALESPSEIQSFLGVLPDTCPNLSGLMLAFLSLSVSSPTHTTEITLETLRPLFAIQKLKDFGITYNYPLRVTHEDCEVLARGLSRLRSLYLCESSYDTHDRASTNLSLASLVPFAEHCHHLEQLGLFFDAAPGVAGDDGDSESPSTTPTVSSPIGESNPLALGYIQSYAPLPHVKHPFKKLHSLSVGQSFLPSKHVTPTALFLSMLLPPGCQFQTGCTDKPHCFSPTYHEASPHPESDDAFQTRLNHWAEVKKLVPTLQSIRLMEYERAISAERERESLKEEVERLRREVEVLKGMKRI